MFYRLNVASLRIPPLREDIPMLFAQFVQEAAMRFGQPVLAVPREVQQQLLPYDWPGNVRELRNAAEQMQLGIPLSIGTAGPQGGDVTPSSLDEIIASVEKVIIADTLRRHDGVTSAACAELKVNYSTLYRKMKSYNMDLSQYRGMNEG